LKTFNLTTKGMGEFVDERDGIEIEVWHLVRYSLPSYESCLYERLYETCSADNLRVVPHLGSAAEDVLRLRRVQFDRTEKPEVHEKTGLEL